MFYNSQISTSDRTQNARTGPETPRAEAQNHTQNSNTRTHTRQTDLTGSHTHTVRRCMRPENRGGVRPGFRDAPAISHRIGVVRCPLAGRKGNGVSYTLLQTRGSLKSKGCNIIPLPVRLFRPTNGTLGSSVRRGWSRNICRRDGSCQWPINWLTAAHTRHAIAHLLTHPSHPPSPLGRITWKKAQTSPTVNIFTWLVPTAF